MKRYNIEFGDIEVKFYSNIGNEEFLDDEPIRLHRFKVFVKGAEIHNVTEIEIPFISVYNDSVTPTIKLSVIPISSNTITFDIAKSKKI